VVKELGLAQRRPDLLSPVLLSTTSTGSFLPRLKLSGITPSAKYKVKGSVVQTVSFSADVRRKDDRIPFRQDGEIRVLFYIITLGFTSLLGCDVPWFQRVLRIGRLRIMQPKEIFM